MDFSFGYDKMVINPQFPKVGVEFSYQSVVHESWSCLQNGSPSENSDPKMGKHHNDNNNKITETIE